MSEFTPRFYESVDGHAECPECFAEVEIVDRMQNEILQCPECGVDLEVVSIDPITLDIAPGDDEDVGE